MRIEPVRKPADKIALVNACASRPRHEVWRCYSTKVTLLISFSVVTPSRILFKPLSRSVSMPSSRAMRLISDVGLRSTIISRIRSVRSSSSQIAVRPWNPVPEHSRQPAPSTDVSGLDHTAGLR